MKKENWLYGASVYQIYPRSFCDSNGDGVGDLRGIIGKLDYIKALGVDAVWLCPIYASPNDDNGYDISDYQSIHSDYGTLADFDELVAGLHARGLKLIMDMVLNHTSDEHAWFVESRSSKSSPKRNWYHWLPGRLDGSGAGTEAPNGWQSMFSGPAWEKDVATGEWYLHLFSRKQPDLNWENPVVRLALYDMMRWWLSRGIDGFRLDVINFISKVPGYPDGANAFTHVANGPRVHEFLSEMHREVFEPFGAVAIGETPGVSPELARLYTDPDRKELDVIFQFEMMDADSGPRGKFDARPLRGCDLLGIMKKWQEGLADRGWNSLYWNNHDQPRVISRFGESGLYREISGKALAAFLYLQKGTPFIYQGEEIGMVNTPWQDYSQLRDIESLNFITQARTETVDGKRVWTDAEILYGIRAKGRDSARTPFQWNRKKNAGFSEGVPWIAPHPDWSTINAEVADLRADSILSFYRKLLAFRKSEEAILSGGIEFVDTGTAELCLYRRFALADDGRRAVSVWVGANLSPRRLVLDKDGPWSGSAHPALSNCQTVAKAECWQPWELRVWYGL